jgi:hypothetical protein
MEPHRTEERALRVDLWILAGFLVLFLLIFAQFAAQGRLPGNIDTWYAIAFTNAYLNEVREAVGLGSFGTFLHPVENPFAYGETSLALALLPMALRAVGLPDVTAYYVFLAVIYAVTGFGAFKVATLYVRPRGPCILAGVIFSASNFLLSTIDSPHTTFFGLAFLSFHQFKQYILEERRRSLWLAATLAGLQVWFSAYVFLLLAVGIGALTLANLKRLVPSLQSARRLAAPALLAALIASPFFLAYFAKLEDYFSWRSQALLFAEFNSLDLQDLLNPMPDNLIYPEGHRFDHEDSVRLQQILGREDPALNSEEFYLMIGASPLEDEESLWVASRKRAFIGLLPLALAAAGWMVRRPGRGELTLLALISLALALGPVNRVGSLTVPMPAWLLYDTLPGFHMFRIPGRAFALTLLAVAAMAARGLGWILERWGRGRPRVWVAVSALACLVVLAENVPVPMRSFEGSAFSRPPERYARFFSDKPDADILNLPSGIGYGLAGSADDLNVFNRELIYMNWQAHHGCTIANGVNGYIPNARIQVQRLIAALPSEEAIRGLEERGITHLVFNKNLLLRGEAKLLRQLLRAPGVTPEMDSRTTTIFKVGS